MKKKYERNKINNEWLSLLDKHNCGDKYWTLTIANCGLLLSWDVNDEKVPCAVTVAPKDWRKQFTTEGSKFIYSLLLFNDAMTIAVGQSLLLLLYLVGRGGRLHSYG